MGDPIEVEALSNVFSPRSGRPLLIGSLKTNIGHGEAISGISSIIKATLALEHELIPPTINIRSLNPDLKLEVRNFEVVTELIPWPRDTLQRISVNSFGYGGANAHAILDSARVHIPQVHEPDASNLRERSSRSFLLPFSAKTSNSLIKNMEKIISYELEPFHLQDLAYTLESRRSQLPMRGYLIGTEAESGPQFPSSPRTEENVDSQLPFAFVFTGQGAQWPRMGAALFARFATYAQSIRELDLHLAALQHAPSWTIEGKIPIIYC